MKLSCRADHRFSLVGGRLGSCAGRKEADQRARFPGDRQMRIHPEGLGCGGGAQARPVSSTMFLG